MSKSRRNTPFLPVDDARFPVRYLGTYQTGTETQIQLAASEINFSPLVERPEGARRDYIWANLQGFFSRAAVLSQCCDMLV
jgi:hypothetical protein